MKKIYLEYVLNNFSISFFPAGREEELRMKKNLPLQLFILHIL